MLAEAREVPESRAECAASPLDGTCAFINRSFAARVWARGCGRRRRLSGPALGAADPLKVAGLDSTVAELCWIRRIQARLPLGAGAGRSCFSLRFIRP